MGAHAVKFLANSSEIVSVSQLIGMLHDKIPWGSKQKAKLVWRNMRQVYEQVEHSHQLLQIWEKFSLTREVELFAMVDDVGAPDSANADVAAIDVCALAAAEQASMYHITLQVDPYTAKLDNGEKMVVGSVDVKLMVDPRTITVGEILEQLRDEIVLGSNQTAHLAL